MSGRRAEPRVDTIVARATPPGVGAVALIRISGPDAFPLLESLCPGLDGRPEPRRATLAAVRDPGTGELLDRALVTVFPAPDSYTGEDLVEISGHGGFLAPSLIEDAVLGAGGRAAEPGEFTRRAYLNGKMDLVQAEAVADLVESKNRALHGAALHQVERGLSERLSGLREELVHLESLLTHHIDFPEEDEPPVPLERIVERAREVEGSLERLLRTAPEGELLREGAVTVLAGRPNSGKSSLFNALLGEERAIVTEVPGTTRDALEAVVSLERFPFRLVDTAGLREVEDRVERIGIEVARRYLQRADVVLLCVEAGRRLHADERDFLGEVEGSPLLLLRTKVDRVGGEASEGTEALRDGGAPSGVIHTSVRTGEGLDRLRKHLPELVYRGLVETGVETPVLTRRRHARGIREAREELGAFGRALEDGVPPEVAATHLRPAESALEEILGVIAPDDVLDRVFRDFCIGK